MSLRVLSTAFLLVASHLGCQQQAPPASEETPASPSRPGASLVPTGGRSIADVAAQVIPSVVSIRSEGPIYVLGAVPPHARLDPPGADGTGRGPHGFGMHHQSVGSGVIVSPGLVVTSTHVVARAEHIEVALHDGRTLEATLIAADPDSDIAILGVEAEQLPAIGIADSSSLRVGDVVLAIGNPYGIGQTVTMGIVSAVGRSGMELTRYDDFIQTDAAINPGSSGGALVNMDGQLVGINTALLSRSGGYQGIGFAIPSRMAIQIKDALVEHGRVIRGWFGAGLHDLTGELRDLLELEGQSGVMILDVARGSPAARAGLRMGDVVTSFDDIKMMTSNQLQNTVAMTQAGKRVRIEAIRDHEPRSFEVTIAEEPESLSTSGPQRTAEGSLLAGLTVQDLDAAVRARSELPDHVRGIVVVAVEPRSRVGLVGVEPGDLILELNGEPTPTVSAFLEATAMLEDQAIALVDRGGATVYVMIAK